MDNEFVLSYYKSFCTKISDLKSFFGTDSTFFFVGDSGNTFIAYGKEDIEQQIEDEFWPNSGSNVDNSLIAYNINIEKKTKILCPETNPSLFDNRCDGVAIAVIGTLKSIHSEDDVLYTKAMGRRFVQTFMVRKAEENYIQNSVFAFLAPTTDLFSKRIRAKESPPLPLVCNDVFSGQQKSNSNEDNVKDLDFDRIVKNIDKLMDDNNDSIEDFDENKIDFNSKQLIPIFESEDDLWDDKRQQLNQSFRFEQYFDEVWTQALNKNTEKELIFEEKIENRGQSPEDKSQETSDDHNSGTSFADVLRDGLQSWQSVKTEDKPVLSQEKEFRIITNCMKSKFKQSCLKASADRKPDFLTQQDITIIGAQNLEDFADNQIVFVANIPIRYPKTEFSNLFDIYGKVLSIKFVERIGVSFAFIYFESSRSVDEVFKSTNGNNLSLSGLQLKVDRYKPRIPLYMS